MAGWLLPDDWTESGHKAALARIDALMGADPGTAEGYELSALADLVVAYEAKHFPTPDDDTEALAATADPGPFVFAAKPGDPT